MSRLRRSVEFLKNSLIQPIHTVPLDVIILVHELDAAGDALNGYLFLRSVCSKQLA